MVNKQEIGTSIWERDIDWDYADRAVRTKAQDSFASLRDVITENAFELGARA